MRSIALAAAGALLLLSAPALAADFGLDDEIGMATSHWDGPYIGLGGTVFSSTTIVEHGAGIVGLIGINKAVDGNLVIGAEAYLGYAVTDLPDSFFILGVEGRAGGLVTDDVLLYGALGLETADFAANYVFFGGGAEFAATEDVSVDLEYRYYVGLDNPWQGHELDASLNWHF